MAADPGIDALAVVYVPTLVLDPEAAADAIAEGVAAASIADLPVVAVFLTGAEPPPRALRDAGIPVHGFPEDAARALGRRRAAARALAPPFAAGRGAARAASRRGRRRPRPRACLRRGLAGAG